MFKKLIVLMLAGMLVFGTSVTAFATERTVAINAGDYIFSKGNPEGTTDNYKKYIIVYNLTNGGTFPVAAGSRIECHTTGNYRVVGDFEVQKSDRAAESLTIEVTKETANKLNEICHIYRCSNGEAVDKAVASYQTEEQ